MGTITYWLFLEGNLHLQRVACLCPVWMLQVSIRRPRQVRQSLITLKPTHTLRIDLYHACTAPGSTALKYTMPICNYILKTRKMKEQSICRKKTGTEEASI